jgi:hypothetical protein
MSDFENAKLWTVDFENVNDYTKVSFSGVYSRSAEKAIDDTKELLNNPDKWRCVKVDIASD